MAQGLRELLEGAKSRIQEIGTTDAAALLSRDQQILFLDVRESEELTGGRIPGAIHIPRGLIEPKAAHDSPARDPHFTNPSRPIIAFCASGVRSALAADSLQRLGFTEVKSLAGGFGAWESGGHPIE